MDTYIPTHGHIHRHTDTYIPTQGHLHTDTRTRTYRHTDMYIPTHEHVHTDTQTRTYRHTYTQTHGHVHTNTRTRTHRQTDTYPQIDGAVSVFVLEVERVHGQGGRQAVHASNPVCMNEAHNEATAGSQVRRFIIRTPSSPSKPTRFPRLGR